MSLFVRLLTVVVVSLWGLLCAPQSAQADDTGKYFKITVVDKQTHRGIPLVELRTTSNVHYVTDSWGVIAFEEPGLMNTDVFFWVQSHGYTFPADAFGYRGTKLHVKAGASATLEMLRVNLAERLYRITGEGIYRDTVLLGEKPPTQMPLLNGQVTGQDTVEVAPYKGKLYWFWGDTARPAYPLGNFATSGATSLLPDKGGLDPANGIDLTYFVNGEGFCRAMAPLPDPGVVWIDAVMTVPDASGQESLLCRYERLKGLGTPLERGLMRFNDKTQTFERLAKFDMANPLYPQGHPFRHTVDGTEYLYFPTPYPKLRVKATLPDVQNLSHYEAYTPFVTGSRFVGTDSKLDRDASGKLVWAWKRDTSPLSPPQQNTLVKASKMRTNESPFALRDLDTGKDVEAQGGSVYWNAYRKCWIMICVQAGGTSYLGEIWYAESGSPEGAWRDAKKIVTHDHYTFYNPTQHPFFDQQGGQIIYFEGTYTNQFTGSPDTPPTPRYDYNQIMYRLDLADERLRTKANK